MENGEHAVIPTSAIDGQIFNQIKVTSAKKTQWYENENFRNISDFFALFAKECNLLKLQALDW